MNTSFSLILVVLKMPYPRKSPSGSGLADIEFNITSRVDFFVALPPKRELPHSAKSAIFVTSPPPVNASDTIPVNGKAETFV